MTTLPAVVRIVDLPTATTITGAEMLEVVQTGVGGTAISVQIPLTSIMTTTLGALPTGGGTSQILAKSSNTNYSTAWYDLTSFVSVISTTGLATSGSGTALVVAVATAGITRTQMSAAAIGSAQLDTSAILRANVTAFAIGSAQIDTAAIQSFHVATNAIGTAQLATNIGIIGTLSVAGTASFSGGVSATGTLNQVGTSLITGTFGVVGTATFTGVYGVVGTALFTSGAFGIVGTTLVTGRLGVVGTATYTGAFNVVGTTNITGLLTVSGTTTLSSLATGNLISSGTGVVSAPIGQLFATNTNDNATTGNIGEYISVTQSTAVALTSNVALTVTSTSLTAGDWEVTGTIVFNFGAGTVMQTVVNSVSLANNTLDGTVGRLNSFNFGATSSIVPAGGFTMDSPPVRLSLASSTSVYLVALSGFTTNTATVSGMIRARRTR